MWLYKFLKGLKLLCFPFYIRQLRFVRGLNSHGELGEHSFQNVALQTKQLWFVEGVCLHPVN